MISIAFNNHFITVSAQKGWIGFHSWQEWWGRGQSSIGKLHPSTYKSSGGGVSEVTFSLLSASPSFTPGSSEAGEMWYLQDGAQTGFTGDANSDYPCYSYHSHRQDLEMSGKWGELRGGTVITQPSPTQHRLLQYQHHIFTEWNYYCHYPRGQRTGEKVFLSGADGGGGEQWEEIISEIIGCLLCTVATKCLCCQCHEGIDLPKSQLCQGTVNHRGCCCFSPCGYMKHPWVIPPLPAFPRTMSERFIISLLLKPRILAPEIAIRDKHKIWKYLWKIKIGCCVIKDLN